MEHHYKRLERLYIWSFFVELGSFFGVLILKDKHNISILSEYIKMHLHTLRNQTEIFVQTSFYIFQRCTYVVYISYQHIYFNIYSIFSFMCMFFKSLFVFFLLTILLSVFLRLTNSDCPLVVFKLFSQILMQLCFRVVAEIACQFELHLRI